MRKGILVIDDLEDRRGHQRFIGENAGTDQWKVGLALQASFEGPEFPLRFRIAFCTSAFVPAPKQRLTLCDSGSIMQVQDLKPRLRTEPQEFPHLIALRGEARALITAKPVDHQNVIGMPV